MFYIKIDFLIIHLSKKYRHSTNIYKKAGGRCPGIINHYYPDAATGGVL